MSSSWLGTGRFLLAISLAHVLGLYLFMSGFLLTRLELPRRSQCGVSPISAESIRRFAKNHAEISQLFLATFEQWVQAGSPLELPPPRQMETRNGCWYPRLADKVILVVVDAMRFDFAHTELDEDLNDRASNNFRHQLTIFDELASRSPDRARLFVFEADPPTTTMQRLKALVTGGMPTFIDVSSNFDSTAIREDNIIDQFAWHSLRIVHMGDDTWINLFPSSFVRSSPFPSFNVKDLDTVDNGVVKHLRPEVDAGQFDVLIAHFLGVDHVGHRFHANHPTMRVKLQFVNDVLTDLFESIDNGTVVFVLGDHGMTSDGNHGGTTRQETDAALFIYSKLPIFRNDDHNAISRVKQVDLVPTLSLMMGVPIPYGSLGMIIPELFSIHGDANNIDTVVALRVNAWQVQLYLQEYATLSGIFTPEAMQHLVSDLLHTDAMFLEHAMKGTSLLASEDLADLVSRYKSILQRSGMLCRQKWTTFDMGSMWIGIFVIVIAVIVLAIFLVFQPTRFPPLRHLISSVTIGTLSANPMAFLLLGNSAPNMLSLCGVGAAVAFMLHVGIFVVSDETCAGVKWPPHFPVAVAVAVVVAYEQGSFSSSLVLADALSVRYMAVTMSLLLALFDMRSSSIEQFPNIVGRSLTIALAIRFMGDGESFGPGTLLPEEFFGQLFETYFFLGGLALMAHIVVGKFPPEGTSKKIVPRTLPMQMWVLSLALAVSVYWWLDPTITLANLPHSKSFLKWVHSIALPRYVYLTSAVMFAAVIIETFVFPERRRRRPFMVLSLIIFCVLGPLLLVQGPRSPRIHFFAFLIILLLFTRATPKHWPAIPETIFLWFLSLHIYFATGHGNTFSSLQVSSAFVGFDKFSFYRSGFMVGLNTFGSFIVLILAVAVLFTRAPSVAAHPSFCRAAQSIVILNSIRGALTVLNVTLQRRHLMVWDIFAPKFAFDCVLLVVQDAIVLGVLSVVIQTHKTSPN